MSTVPVDGNGLLRGSCARSYGSLVRTSSSPVQQRRIEHQLQPGETLQGVALKYGVSMEQIKRANRLYTNDSIFLKKSLSIPVLSDLDGCSVGMDLAQEESPGDYVGQAPAQYGCVRVSSEKKPDNSEDGVAELTPERFLNRLDELINRSKQAAVKRCKEAEQRVADLEAACNSVSPHRPFTTSHSLATLSVKQHQRQEDGSYVVVPHTVNKLTKKLRDREDEIFEL